MQSDSNVQNMSNNKFTSQLSEEMFKNNVIFQKILHVPTLNADLNVSEDFEEFLWDLESENGDVLIEQHPQLEGFIKNVLRNLSQEWVLDHASNLVADHSDFEFLVNLKIAIPYDFSFGEDGAKFCISLGRSYRCQWIFAKTMKDAAEQAINIAKKIRTEEIEKARIEQGLEG
ncbi:MULTISPECIES: hypothetical protein [Acinetobacter calcoaceticus/baumannii complex]|uniref:hypothetical protein n=1 Tax=Acinetobacter calcoaceticus/baumannii complex TaxID=909768 RepID=UPI00233FB978|nr:hypothetical protein [Acinetobacter baumannii]MDC4075708.1 hypothetical protein [Acinetobacter baumannii]MDC4101520.1 hypothetical protein [Acinetobacter baumannii]